MCRRNVPITELRPILQPPTGQRRIGIDRGMDIPDSFFEPLLNDLNEALEGNTGADEAIGGHLHTSVAGRRRSEAVARAERASCLSPENSVYLGAQSAWEIAVKHRLGRLPVPLPPHV